MKNNIIKYFFIVLLVFGTITSCKDYLEVNPVSSFGPDYIFSNVTNATRAVYGAYAALGGDQGYGIRISMYYPYDNDEMMGQGGNPGDNERRDIARYSVQPGNTQLANPFNQLYSGIEMSNICIYNIPRMEMYNSGTEVEKRQLRRLHGEALTLRAQYYYELIRNWGDVPAQFLPASHIPDLFLEKEDRDIIYDQLLQDLEQAAQLVPWRSEISGRDERITQGAVRALRARIALAKGGYSLRLDRQMKRPDNYIQFYQIARDETWTIIQRSRANGDHQLNPSFEAIFRALTSHSIEPYGEILWEVGMTGGSSSTGDSKLGYYNGPRYDGRGNSALTVLPTYFYSFDPNDSRRDVTVAPYNVNADFTIQGRPLNNLFDGKFRRDWITNPTVLTSSAQYFGVNWPLIRYSDVLLMFAEAENEINNGPTANAIEAFEEVRLRAFNGNESLIGTTPSDKSGFFEAIVNERSLELGGEGIRKYDLIRWNLLGQKLSETRTKLRDMVDGNEPYQNLPTTMYYRSGSNTLEWMNSFYEPTPAIQPEGSTAVTWIHPTNIHSSLTDLLAVGFTPGRSELLPIHTTVLDANPKLTQDYGH